MSGATSPDTASSGRRAVRRVSGGGAGIWLLGLVCGAAATLATSYAVLAAICLAPGLILLAADTAPGRPGARAVLCLGAATLVHPVMLLWSAGHRMDAAIALATDPRILALAWAVQGLGWLAIELGPVAIRFGMEASARARAQRLRRLRAQLEEEWGIPPLAEADE